MDDDECRAFELDHQLWRLRYLEPRDRITEKYLADYIARLRESSRTYRRPLSFELEKKSA